VRLVIHDCTLEGARNQPLPSRETPFMSDHGVNRAVSVHSGGEISIRVLGGGREFRGSLPNPIAWCAPPPETSVEKRFHLINTAQGSPPSSSQRPRPSKLKSRSRSQKSLPSYGIAPSGALEWLDNHSSSYALPARIYLAYPLPCPSHPSEGLREDQGLVGEDLLFERGVRSVIIPVTKKRWYDQKRDEDSIPMKI